jgi:hypothetical protein
MRHMPLIAGPVSALRDFVAGTVHGYLKNEARRKTETGFSDGMS